MPPIFKKVICFSYSILTEGCHYKITPQNVKNTFNKYFVTNSEKMLVFYLIETLIITDPTFWKIAKPFWRKTVRLRWPCPRLKVTIVREIMSGDPKWLSTEKNCSKPFRWLQDKYSEYSQLFNLKLKIEDLKPVLFPVPIPGQPRLPDLDEIDNQEWLKRSVWRF